MNIPLVTTEAPTEEEKEALVDKGMSPAEMRQKMIQNFQVIQTTIRAYTVYIFTCV
ncbi:MAG: hypothetical protein N2235_15445 [Fischerella sp.]|nr:hypothetical protein [Fischerella sp.]